MSVKASALVWDCGRFEGSKLLVLLALADHADHDGGNIFPALKTVARKVRLSARQVRTILRALEADGAICATARRAGGRGLTTLYQIDMERLTAWRVAAEKGEADRLSDATGKAEKEEADRLHSDSNGAKKEEADFLLCEDAEAPGAKGGSPARERRKPGARKAEAAASAEPDNVNNRRARAREDAAAPLADGAGDAAASELRVQGALRERRRKRLERQREATP